MKIELQLAFSEEDIPDGQPCGLCGIKFTGKAVIIRSGPHGYETCEECLRALSQRMAPDSRAPWPTWEEYEALDERHPVPMFASSEAFESSEPVTGDDWPAQEASWLWKAPRETA